MRWVFGIVAAVVLRSAADLRHICLWLSSIYAWQNQTAEVSGRHVHGAVLGEHLVDRAASAACFDGRCQGSKRFKGHFSTCQKGAMVSWQVALLEELQKVSQGHDGEGMLGCILMHFVLAVTCCYSLSFNDQKIEFTPCQNTKRSFPGAHGICKGLSNLWWQVKLLMEEILHYLGCIKHCK